MKDKHFSCLEKMYLAAPINDFYQPTISVAESECEISICLNDKFLLDISNYELSCMAAGFRWHDYISHS